MNKSKFLFTLTLSIFIQFSLFSQENSKRLDNIAEKIRLLEQKIKERKDRYQGVQNNPKNTFSFDKKNESPVEDPPEDSFFNDNKSLNLEPSEPEEYIEPVASNTDWYESDAFEIEQDPLNQISLSLSIVNPGDIESNGKALEFDTGVDFGLEYSRFFADNSYIGGGFSYKTFNASGSDTYGPYDINYDGDASLLSFYGTLGQKWALSHSIGLLTQASAGIGVSDYNIKFTNFSGLPIPNTNISVSDSSFYYSLLLGLDFQLSRSWHAALFYELDGRSEAGTLDYQNFHQFGVKTSFGF